MIIYIADFYRINREHQVYNMTMLDILSMLPKISQVNFMAHDGQIAYIKAEHQFQSGVPINFIPVRVHHRVGGKHWISKIYYELKNACALLKTAAPDDFIFFCSLSPITSLFFKIYKKKFPNKKVIITLHGDIDFIQQNKSRFRNLLGKFFKWSFRLKDNYTKYLVLSDTIRQNLIREHFLASSEVFAINHPYVFDRLGERKSNSKTLHIGHIGVASTEKNTQFIFELAALLKTEIGQGKVKFSIIGMSANIHEYSNALVTYNNAAEMLSKDEFNTKIDELDYTVFFYSDENYKFCSSGAILDAIHHKIPILSIKNQGFQAIFAEADGEIGILVNDVKEMAQTIRRIIQEPDPEKYTSMVNNLAAYQEKYTTEHVSKQLLKQIKTFLYEC
jgi:glycosyltransferase involved in cell wall biosynthesis